MASAILPSCSPTQTTITRHGQSHSSRLVNLDSGVAFQTLRIPQPRNGSLPTAANPINGTQRLRVSNVSAIRVHGECSPAESIVWDISNHALAASIGHSCTTGPISYQGDPPFPWWYDSCFSVVPGCINAINASAPAPRADLLGSPLQDPVAVAFWLNQSAASTAFCYATWEMYSITAELDLLSGRLIPQVWDESLVRGYFSGQDYAWAPNGCVCALNLQHSYSRLWNTQV
jgi:hypothetical protein